MYHGWQSSYRRLSFHQCCASRSDVCYTRHLGMSAGRLYPTFSPAGIPMSQQPSIIYAADNNVSGDKAVMTAKELGLSNDWEKQNFLPDLNCSHQDCCMKEKQDLSGSCNCSPAGSLCHSSLPSPNQHAGTTESTVTIHLENWVNRHFTLVFCRKNPKSVLWPSMTQGVRKN